MHPWVLFSGVNSSSSFRLSKDKKCSIPLLSFMVLAGLAPGRPCPLVLGNPVLATALQEGPYQCWVERKILSFGLLSLRQTRRLLIFCAARAHYWLMFSLESTRTPRSVSVKLLPRHPEFLVNGSVFSRCRTLYFPLSNVMQSHFSRLMMSLWTT